ncbi:MAG: helix-turn-helix domain-containing protein [Clostridia bacterium]|nr:helix-turn-helix domain-containing protein [Clostridia bacterium]
MPQMQNRTHEYAVENFIRFLVDGKRETTVKEIESRKKVLGLDWLTGPFAVVQVATDYAAVPHEERDAALLAYEEQVVRALRAIPAAHYVYTNSYNNVVVLFAFGGKPMTVEEMNACFIDLHRQMVSRFGMDGFIGIGNVVDTYQDIALSAATAAEMLGFKFQYAESGVVNSATIVQFQYNMGLGNGIEFDRVTGAFRDGNLSKMEQRLIELAETIRRRPNVSGTSIRRSMVEVAVHVLHLASNAGVDVEQALDGADPYRWIMRQNHTEVIIAWILKLSARLLAQMKERRENGQKDVIRQMIQYIDENLSKTDISLDRIGQAVGLSRTYCSQLFKKEEGMGISAYITGQRVLRAQQLLRDTDLSVAEISRQTGFSSHGYFGQVFRRVTGQTPQEYRRSSRKA